jgi:LysR family transcriptional regulator, hydrogen peroxide-inducible genes activator
MTLTQLEYIVAVDHFRHFVRAAEACFVTQPTLSMQIQKLEQELGILLFDRSKQPITPTRRGIAVIEQARKVLSEASQITEMVQHRKNVITGDLRLGIIPTLAPYLLPLFLRAFTRRHPQVKLIVGEYTTEIMLTKLREGRLDLGILVTPLNDPAFTEQVLFYEELIAYVAKGDLLAKKHYLLAKDIDPNKLWLLEEGHCFRSQILNLCELRRSSAEGAVFEYEAGSIETLRRMVERNDGITILPELATLDLNATQQKLLRFFKHPAPVREVSVVAHRDFEKKRLTELLRKEILQHLPDKVKKNTSGCIVPLD